VGVELESDSVGKQNESIWKQQKQPQMGNSNHFIMRSWTLSPIIAMANKSKMKLAGLGCGNNKHIHNVKKYFPSKIQLQK
jgi:hypothetical protein